MQMEDYEYININSKMGHVALDHQDRLILAPRIHHYYIAQSLALVNGIFDSYTFN